jgi:hypothetical protein
MGLTPDGASRTSNEPLPPDSSGRPGATATAFRQAGSRLTHVTSAIPIGPAFVYNLPDHPLPAPDRLRFES